jgi:hypothetical protein
VTRRTILIQSTLVLVAFGLGVAVGSHVCRRPVLREPVLQEAVPQPGAGARVEPSSVGSSPCVDMRNAGPLTGKSGCVTGLVLRVYAARSGNTFLDFCENYRTCTFSSVIFASDKSKFGDLGTLQGRRIEIRGDIVDYQGHAEIVIHDPKQMRSSR